MDIVWDIVSVCKIQSMKITVKLKSRHWTPCKGGLYVKPYSEAALQRCP